MEHQLEGVGGWRHLAVDERDELVVQGNHEVGRQGRTVAPGIVSSLEGKEKNGILLILIQQLKRNDIESNLSVPRIQGCHEIAFHKSFGMSTLDIFVG